MFNTLKMIAIARMSGYLGMPKGVSSIPQAVLRIDKNRAKSPAQSCIVIMDFYRSYSTPISPKTITI